MTELNDEEEVIERMADETTSAGSRKSSGPPLRGNRNEWPLTGICAWTVWRRHRLAAAALSSPRFDRPHNGGDESLIHRSKLGDRVRPDNVGRQRFRDRRSRAIVCH
jgi:hypothetical protein